MVKTIFQHWVIITLVIISTLFCLDMFLHSGEAATFDSPIHITNMAMYQRALADGDFPVTWADNFANYGLPIPLVSQQTTSYLGALLNFITHSSVLSYKLVLFVATITGSFGMYQFLKKYMSDTSAQAGSILFTLSAYRIINVYIRGALPEFFASSLIPFLLLAIHNVFEQKWYASWLLVALSALLISTHPFVFLIGSFIFIPYTWYEYRVHQQISIKSLIKIAVALGFGLLLNAWYLFPLVLEMKYFVISRNITQLVPNQFLTIANFFSEKWRYFYHNDVFIRGNIIQFGAIESLLFLIGIPVLYVIQHKRKQKQNLLFFICLTSIFLVFMTLPLSLVLYQHIPYLDGIQFPWRMLTALSIFPPLILGLLLDKFPRKLTWTFIFVIVVLITRLPEAYGKNFTVYPEIHYQKTIKNLHFDSLNTIWTGNTLSYPVKQVKGEIIEGNGQIVSRQENNSRRVYQIDAISPVRMVDYTFYFPGWKVYVDGQETNIEFQDVNYRGVITYWVPAGSHQVLVEFFPTKVRLAGMVITLISIVVVLIGFFIHSKVRLNHQRKK